MKRVLHLAFFLFISFNLFAQAPQKMTYQAVIRNASNNLVVNAPVKMKISILQGSASGTAVYSELHNPTTNANGLVSIEIGSGTSPVGTIGSINWGNGTYFLKTETDPTNGTNYSIVGTSQFLSVPYALYAEQTKKLEKVVFLGTNSGDSLEIPANTDIFMTGDGLWNPNIKLPIPKTSNQMLKDRQGAILQLICNSSFAFHIQTIFTDLKTPLTLTTGENATFIFDKNIWRLISHTRGLVPYNGSEGQTLTMCGGIPTWGPCLPRLTTKSVNYTELSTDAQSGGDISYNGSSPVTARGVVWSTSTNPTIILSTKTGDGSGNGSFSSNITGLSLNTTYYVRAYATSNTGTSYGNEVSFKTSSGITGTTIHSCGATNVHNSSLAYGTMNDQDGNIYRTVKIGNQVWMAENLKTTKYRNGLNILNITDNTQWQNNTTGAYCSYNNNTANDCPYGKLYNWHAVNNANQLCPTGWHVPTDDEWIILENTLGGSVVAGGKMKSTGIQYWQTPNANASNSSGFSGVPGGWRVIDGFGYVSYYGAWWSSSQSNSTLAWSRYLDYANSNLSRNINEIKNGFSVRCIKD